MCAQSWRSAASGSLPAAPSPLSKIPARITRRKLSSGNHVTADRVMFATGRVPNVDKLGLEEAGVKIAKNGGIAVDEYSRTSVAEYLRRR